MEDEEMEKKVQQYLQRKGFRLTELALQEERNRISTSSVSDVALASCEGALLASGSADCTVKLWDVASSTKVLKTDDTSTNRLRMLKTLRTKSTPVYTLRFSRRNLLFAAGALSLGS
ncbi:hypothetical protein OsI_23914 [Oryza sativa Indica Group]|uniref:Uncharacterized protein n=1 Tax=Oryza sativa subsp. indica TaxID=39946 RepID=A2YFN0_ORYSI|nr:hypothetical protein OsI_23914 [Oryza sativa Indica Group]